MRQDGGDRGERRASPELSLLTLTLASAGSAVATALVSRLGLTGTIVGAALAPVVIALVRELGRAPAKRIARFPGDTLRGARPPRPRRPRVRWPVVGVTSAIAFLIAVAAFTVPDLVRGQSVVSDRQSTFFSDGGQDGPAGGPATTTEERTTTAPETTAPETTAPPTTAPETPAPPTSAPETAPAAPAADAGPTVPQAPTAPAPPVPAP